MTDLRTALEEARRGLLDLSTRNRLLSLPKPGTSRGVMIIDDEDADFVLGALQAGRAFGFEASAAAPEAQPEEASPGTPRRAVLEMNSLPGILEAVRSGLGIGALPDYMGDQLDGLVQVLPELKAPRIEAYFVYPEELRHSKRVAVFRDFLVSELAAPNRLAAQ